MVLAVVRRACHPAPAGLIALICNEIAHRSSQLIIEPARRTLDATAKILDWANRRSRHQRRARTSHYQARPET
jgi:hypothetical protein